MKPHYQHLFRYVAWADRRSLESLRATPAAFAEALPLMAHVLAAEHVWLSRLERRTPRHAVWPTLDLEQCGALLAENERGYAEFLASITEDQFASNMHYKTSQGQEMVSTVLDILTQVVTHGSYHRGQIA
jgi:uncharacterized damage-inducible protein DinB